MRAVKQQGRRTSSVNDSQKVAATVGDFKARCVQITCFVRGAVGGRRLVAPRRRGGVNLAGATHKDLDESAIVVAPLYLGAGGQESKTKVVLHLVAQETVLCVEPSVTGGRLVCKKESEAGNSACFEVIESDFSRAFCFRSCAVPGRMFLAGSADGTVRLHDSSFIDWEVTVTNRFPVFKYIFKPKEHPLMEQFGYILTNNTPSRLLSCFDDGVHLVLREIDNEGFLLRKVAGVNFGVSIVSTSYNADLVVEDGALVLLPTQERRKCEAGPEAPIGCFVTMYHKGMDKWMFAWEGQNYLTAGAGTTLSLTQMPTEWSVWSFQLSTRNSRMELDRWGNLETMLHSKLGSNHSGLVVSLPVQRKARPVDSSAWLQQMKDAVSNLGVTIARVNSPMATESFGPESEFLSSMVHPQPTSDLRRMSRRSFALPKYSGALKPVRTEEEDDKDLSLTLDRLKTRYSALLHRLPLQRMTASCPKPGAALFAFQESEKTMPPLPSLVDASSSSFH